VLHKANCKGRNKNIEVLEVHVLSRPELILKYRNKASEVITSLREVVTQSVDNAIQTPVGWVSE
jgi:hypothetical protein